MTTHPIPDLTPADVPVTQAKVKVKLYPNGTWLPATMTVNSSVSSYGQPVILLDGEDLIGRHAGPLSAEDIYLISNGHPDWCVGWAFPDDATLGLYMRERRWVNEMIDAGSFRGCHAP